MHIIVLLLRLNALYDVIRQIGDDIERLLLDVSGHKQINISIAESIDIVFNVIETYYDSTFGRMCSDEISDKMHSGIEHYDILDLRMHVKKILHSRIYLCPVIGINEQYMDSAIGEMLIDVIYESPAPVVRGIGLVVHISFDTHDQHILYIKSVSQ